MALVGPRPERPEFVCELAAQIPLYNQRHRVKAGLTGWAQVNYPYGASVDDARSKLSYDLYYVKNYSIVHRDDNRAQPAGKKHRRQEVHLPQHHQVNIGGNGGACQPIDIGRIDKGDGDVEELLQRIQKETIGQRLGVKLVANE